MQVQQSSEERLVAERLENLEQMIDDRLAALTDVSGDTETVITGITSLAVQLRTKDSQIEVMRRQLEDLRAVAAQPKVESRDLVVARRDVEDLRRRAAGLRKRVAESGRKLADLEAAAAEKRATTGAAATALVKKLMDTVFQEMLEAFQGETKYSGQEIFEQMRASLRKTALGVLDEVDVFGLV
jgi:chromosome segregation ATPase